MPEAAQADAVLKFAMDREYLESTPLRDFREIGDEVWNRFKAPRDRTLWYYRELVKAFQGAGGGPLTRELDRVVSELEREAGPKATPA